MTEKPSYCVALFDSVSQVIKAEKVLLNAALAHKIIPVPKSISTDCGVCVRFLTEQTDAILEALRVHVKVREVRELQ